MRDSLEGSEFAGYSVGPMVGKGGMGVVYLARDARMDRTVALKLILPALADDESFRARFERESTLAAAIDHPNVLPIYEAGSFEGSFFIAMRFVEGTDLRALIGSEAGLEPRRAARIVDDVAGALDAAHSRGLIHRDVKPANVLVAAGDHSYLTDFGLTKRANASGVTQTGQFVGTLDYASPEQLQGAPATEAVDIYALGCVLYEALTGSVPFPRDSEGAKVYAHLSAPPPSASDLAPDVPVELDRVVARALSKQPEERFRTAGELGAAAVAAASGQLWTASDGKQIDSGAATIPPRRVAELAPSPKATTTPRRRRRARVLILAGLALVAGLGVAFALTRGGEPPRSDLAFPGRPGEIAVEDGSVWVVDEEHSELIRIDPASRSITGAPVAVPPRPNDVAIGEDEVWVVSSDGTLTRFAQGDPSDSDRISLGGEPFALALDSESVWVADRGGGRILRVDAERMRVVDTTRVASRPSDIAAGPEGLWVALSAGAQRFDSESGRPHGELIPALNPLESIAVGEGEVWATSQVDGLAIRIDPKSGAASRPISAGIEPEGVAIGDGSAWVTAQRDDALLRFAASTGESQGEPIGVGSDPGGVAYGAGAVWVANYYGRSVTRVEP